MAINPMQGLFAGGGNSLGSIQQKMQLEKQARIRQAMADNASAGGNYYSNLIAKSNAQLGETVKGVAQGLAGGGLGELGKDLMTLTLKVCYVKHYLRTLGCLLLLLEIKIVKRL